MLKSSWNISLYGLLAAVLIGVCIGTLTASDLDVETVSLDQNRMDQFLSREAENVSQEAFERISTPAKLEAERPRLEREFRFMLGLDPLPPRTPLQVNHVRTVEMEDYTIEVLSYQSLPQFYVTANIYKPKTGKPPYPAVIWGPGHSNDPDWNGAKVRQQNYAIPWVRAGYILLLIDAFQISELYGVHRGTQSFAMWDWYSRGYTPIGVDVWNAMRGVDYLLTRQDVDGKKLTINGVSGGGHLSWMTGAADDRFAVVQPVAATCDIQAHVQLDLQRMACDCAYFINTYRHDWTTLAGLIAPRPLLIHCSTGDSYYPPEGYQRVFQRMKEIYSFSGVPDRTHLFEVGGPHGYTQAEQAKAVIWSDHWLLGKDSKVEEQPFQKLPGDQLSVFRRHPPDDSINARIQELFVPAASLKRYETRQAWDLRRVEILEKLKAVVFRNMPNPYPGVKLAEGEEGRFSLETEPGIQVGVALLHNPPLAPGERRPILVYIASPGETLEMLLWNFMRVDAFNTIPASIYVVFPRGIGKQIWEDGLLRKYQRDAMLLGRTLDEMRLFDVLCVIRYAASQPFFSGKEITVAGKGIQGLLGAYAALLEPLVTRVVLHSPPLTHKTGPIFLNVLRYTDVPQALAMLAPRELVFLTHEIDSFEYTKSIYRLCGAVDKFKRGYTITQVLNQSH